MFTDHQARFAIGTRHARMESDAAALFGAVKALLVAAAGRMVRDGTEGAVTKGLQDTSLDQGLDFLMDKMKDKSNNRKP